MKFVKITARLKADRAVELNQFTGSTVRGALISSLSKSFCAKRNVECDSCDAGITCPNKILFNMGEYTDDNWISNPIVINADYLESGEIDIVIKLFGLGSMSAQSIVMVLKNGLYLGKERDKFTPVGDVSVEIMRRDSIEVQPFKGRLRVNFVSPAHLQKWRLNLDFCDFMRCCMYRYMSINRLSNSEPIINYKRLLEDSNKIKLISKDIHAVELGRFSRRTQMQNHIRCLTGSVEYDGDFSDYIGIIRFAEEFNIGKWCTMGLGRITVETIENESTDDLNTGNIS